MRVPPRPAFLRMRLLRRLAQAGFFGWTGLVSIDFMLVSWVRDRSTVVVMPPISISSEPSSFMVIFELSTRPLAVSKRIWPVASLLVRLADLILKGKLVAAAAGGGSYFSVVSTLIF